MHGRSILAGLSGAALLLAAPALAQPPKPAAQNECFFVSQFQNWKPGGDDKTMYIRVGLSRFYRLDLAASCPNMRYPDARLINNFRTSSICSPLDWDMRVSQGVGPGSMAMPCMVKKMTRLSPAEVAALPKKQKP